MKVRDTEGFIRAAVAKHGTVYDYSEVEYVKSNTKVIITCSKHGRFLQSPNNHLSGNGCPVCGKERVRVINKQNKTNVQDFITRARSIHGNKYDYSTVVLAENQSFHSPVVIICPDHGPFEQTPASHLYKESNCPKCSGVHKPTTQEYVEEAKKLHGDKYDYSLVEYVGSHDYITVVCLDHGPWQVLATNHISKARYGCPQCQQQRTKETTMSRYGVEHAAQDPDIHQRMSDHRNTAKTYKLPSGCNIFVQGYEPLALDLLLKTYAEADIMLLNRPSIKYEFADKHKVYHPDIVIPKDRRIIEVKSSYTFAHGRFYDKNIAKAKACAEQGWRFEFWIMHPNAAAMPVIISLL